MKTIIATAMLNLAAWTDSAIGIELRIMMVKPIMDFDVVLAAYIVENVHF